MEELLTFLMVLLILIKIFLKPSSLKQHKIELEQYPVVPISLQGGLWTIHQITYLVLKLITC